MVHIFQMIYLHHLSVMHKFEMVYLHLLSEMHEFDVILLVEHLPREVFQMAMIIAMIWRSISATKAAFM